MLVNVDLSNNQLTSIDVNQLPRLRNLNVDSNRIASIEGLAASMIESVSWRNQSLDMAERKTQLQYASCHEARVLRLSGNEIPKLSLSTPFFALRVLELASSGLEDFSEDFGSSLPNLRVLNINHNAVKDLRPLVGLQRLTELYAAGNRILRLRRSMAVLEKLGKNLRTLDLRMNPITQGFYVPSPVTDTEAQLVVHGKEAAPTEEAQEQNPEAVSQSMVPPLDEASDGQFRARLDSETSLRRRVYELLVFGCARGLQYLDGMRIHRERIVVVDDTWRRLVELGVIEVKEPSEALANIQ